MPNNLEDLQPDDTFHTQIKYPPYANQVPSIHQLATFLHQPGTLHPPTRQTLDPAEQEQSRLETLIK